ncbi:MAG TPA: type I polyketide synthase [Pyrinomonadaceae bacterium]|nr:type I polyketide synthase [Pyrinomonadaceae bacterium]
MSDSFNGTEIAIIGMAGRYPRSRNLDEFWDHLRNGDELISFFTDEELLARGVDPSVVASPQFVKAAVVLDDMDQFDASFFGFTRREAELLDPQHRLFLETAWEALENAGYNSDAYDGLIGVYAGAGVNSYFLTNLFNNPNFGPLEQLSLLLASDKDYMMTRASYKLNLRGPSVMVQSACSTSLLAIHLACQGLLLEECDIALAGASNVHTILRDGYYTVEGGVYSPDGHCRAFDADGKGTLFGSGVGIVVLKRLADALADGDHIEAVIKGSAVNNDGSMKVSYTAPSVEGQAKVIAEALANAGVNAETISYIEAHGTATALGDPIEIQALTKAFRATTDKKGFCAVGSVKSNLGHLDSAAGVTGIIKTVLSLKHKSIPPSLHFKRPNPAIDFENTPFYVNNKLSEWSGPSPRRAGASSFGIGGTNAHIVLEEAPPAVPAGVSRPWQLLVLSAKTEAALETATHNLAEHFKCHPDLNLADAAYTLLTGRKAFKHRKAFVCKELSDAINALESGRVLVGHQPKPRLVAFMFPGQGAQRLQMAQQIYAHEKTFREQVDLCSRLLEPDLNVDLRQILYGSANSPEAAEKLKQTSLAQPALFVVEYALAQLWQEWGIKPWAMVGHSIGEYVAACLAGVFTLEDALKLVAMRGRLMQEAPAGAMLAAPLAAETIRPLMSAKLSLAAINAPQRCVVSGPEEAIADLQSKLEKQELPGQRLHTSHAFHSEMMEPVLEPFRRFLRNIELREPKIPYISNVTGDWITAEQATSPDYWADHLRRTVRFADGVAQLLKEPDCVLLEVGPGQTLTKLARQSANGSAQDAIIAAGDNLEDDLLSLINGAAKLWLAGVELDWSGFYSDERRQRLPLPTYPFERKRYWIERPVATANQQLTRQVPDSAAFEILTTQLHVMDLQLKALREN